MRDLMVLFFGIALFLGLFGPIADALQLAAAG